MINVTKPFLPDRDKFEKLIKEIWDRNWLTNNGPLVNDLELRLKNYLNVKHLLFLNNGTIAIQIAIKALGLQGEIITTPYSYVATTSSILWEACTPIFVDIDDKTLTIDPFKIEEKITPNTTAILATHVYGNACDVMTLEDIAQKHNLKVIYDAAHCFGVTYQAKSIFEYGDISTTSFHATKLFHTVEGGAVITKDALLLKRMSLLRNFGHTSPVTFGDIGINGKNSELHAAMGICNLGYIDNILANRKKQWNKYYNLLQNLEVKFLHIREEKGYNYSYFPIVFKNEEQLHKSVKALNDNYIYPRRYFYPSLNTLPFVKNEVCPVSEGIANSVICLPLYHDLTEAEQEMICRILLRVQNH